MAFPSCRLLCFDSDCESSLGYAMNIERQVVKYGYSLMFARAPALVAKLYGLAFSFLDDAMTRPTTQGWVR